MNSRTSRRMMAFTLIEVTLALGIMAFCLVSLLGLLPIGIKNDQAAIQQTAANAILSAVAADLRAVSRTAPAGGTPPPTAQFLIPIPANPLASATVNNPDLYFSASGTCSQTLVTTGENLSRYRLTVQFAQNTAGAANAPSGTIPRSATFATVQVSWPAVVPLAQATGQVQTFVALNRN